MAYEALIINNMLEKESQVMQRRHYLRNGNHLSHGSPIKANVQGPLYFLHISHHPGPCQYSEGLY